MSAREDRLSDRRRKEIVKKEMELCDKTDVTSASAVHWNDGFRCDLQVTSGPYDARIDGARRSMLTTVERRRERKFDDRNQLVERLAPAGAQHVRVQVRNAVLDRETPLQRMRMAFDVGVAFV